MDRLLKLPMENLISAVILAPLITKPILVEIKTDPA